MTDERWGIVWKLFGELRELSTGQRSRVLADSSVAPELLEEVAALLEQSNCLSTVGAFPPVASAEPEYAPGTEFGKYAIVGLMGQGGFGRIYAAHDKDLRRSVAIKVLNTPLVSRDEQLIEEARAASALNHPNIVTIYETIAIEGHLAIVMEFVDGRSLRQALRTAGGPLPLEQALLYGRQVAQALEAAHAAGIAHRDVKPENILVRWDGYVKLVDFGLATTLSHDGQSSPASLAGTLRYVSPEQLRGESATASSDIFSFGLMLYEMTTGVHPFQGDTPLDTAEAIATGVPLAPSRLSRTVPRALDQLILGMLNKAAGMRPTADEVSARLSAVLEGRSGVRSRRITAASSAVLVALVTIAVIWMNRGPRTVLLRELTSADTENRVTAAAISPDGSLLAYADVTGAILLRAIESSRTRLLSQPEWLIAEKIDWFPDQHAVFVTGRPLSPGPPSAWVVQLEGGQPKLVREGIGTASLSPDGTRFAFTSPDGKEISIAGLEGDPGTRVLVRAGDREVFPVVGWSGSGKAVICQRRRMLVRGANEKQSSYFDPNFQRSYESLDPATGAVLYRQPNISMRSLAVRRDGRALFLWDTAAFSLNVWEMRTDPATGRIEEAPGVLTQYREMSLAGITSSQDGRRIVAVHYDYQPDVYVADIGAGSKQITNIKRVTVDRAHDYPHSFSPDGETVFFESNRNGAFDIFRQHLSERHAEFLAGRPDRDDFNPIVTPDGKWVLFGSATIAEGKDRVLQRVPLHGGEVETVPIGGSLDYFDCTLPEGKRCVLRTTENQEHVFSELDPVKGKGRELARTPSNPGAIMGDWSISPDGTEVAVPNHDLEERFIRVIPLGLPGKPEHVVQLKGGAGMINGVRYSADGAGWFVVLRHGDEYFRTSPLLRVDLVFVDRQGSITPIREVPITSWAVPAPGGRRIAFPDGTVTGNAILLER